MKGHPACRPFGKGRDGDRAIRPAAMVIVSLCMAVGSTAFQTETRATIVQVGFKAVITGISDPALYLPVDIWYADTLVGYYIYDRDAPDQDSASTRGLYEYMAPPSTLVVYADGGWVFSSDAVNRFIRVTIGDSLVASTGPADSYNIRSFNNTAHSEPAQWSLEMGLMQIDLVDSSLAALTGDQLPAQAVDLEDWPDQRQLLIMGYYWAVYAELVAIEPTLPTWAARGPEVAVHLGPNIPNPFSGATTMPFSVERAAHVKLEVYDVGGRRVRVLLDGLWPAGRYEIQWDGRDDRGRTVASGTYFCRLVVDKKAVARRATIIR